MLSAFARPTAIPVLNLVTLQWHFPCDLNSVWPNLAPATPLRRALSFFHALLNPAGLSKCDLFPVFFISALMIFVRFSP